MKTTILGYPRIGANRELKKASESYWKGKISAEALLQVGKKLRKNNWELQKENNIDIVPSNDFSFYDQVLDMSSTLGCVPKRFDTIQIEKSELDLYFAMARGLQDDKHDVTAMEMTKWFDTNYHYIVPEFVKNQQFQLNASKICNEYKEALSLGIRTKPVIIGPVTYLLLGKEKEKGFARIELIEQLLPVYLQLFNELQKLGVKYVQVDEPCLTLNLSKEERKAIKKTYTFFADKCPEVKIILANYFDCYGENLELALDLPVSGLHLDLVKCQLQLNDILDHKKFDPSKIYSLGVVDGRNIWKNDFENSLNYIRTALSKIDKKNIWVSSSCSLLHSPYDLDLETHNLNSEIKQWLSFAKQKLQEVAILKELAIGKASIDVKKALEINKKTVEARKTSTLIHKSIVKDRVEGLTKADTQRASVFSERQLIQKQKLQLPLYPTTTIGSFPQTKEVRRKRSQFKKNGISQKSYNYFLEQETKKAIRFQEAIDLDVLVHGEFERNDMVEYFGERLEGFAFTDYGWVQSYGSRCVKPPIIFGDVSRPKAMTVKWTSFAQSLTNKPVKGMLTGPVTILQWSFVRNDQPKSITCKQIALAIRDEVEDLETAGIQIIQIDEPAIREGLPLRKEEWNTYLDWAIDSFKITSSSVKNETQIHTHMCYSEFNDIIANIAAMDADVITIETSRSEMELLDVFVDFKYPNEIGPGVYDIHSPRIPTQREIENLLSKASELLPIENIWVNPDCGLKTRDWPETIIALENLVQVAKKLRLKTKVLN